MQLDYPGHCLLLFRLPGQPASEPSAAEPSGSSLPTVQQAGPGQQPALVSSGTLVCMIQNSSYASLIKYHLRSSPYIRL